MIKTRKKYVYEKTTITGGLFRLHVHSWLLQRTLHRALPATVQVGTCVLICLCVTDTLLVDALVLFPKIVQSVHRCPTTTTVRHLP